MTCDDRAKRFIGKAALVTGGARGQGGEHVRRLAAEGARVVFTDVLDAEGEALARELGGRALFVRHDVSDEAAWPQLMVAARSFSGGLDHLVNNAGIAKFASLDETTAEAFRRHQGVNELGVFLGMKFCAPLMAERGGGAIVNISSLGAMRVGGNDSAYVGSKWAVRGLSKSAAKELGPFGVRVNSVHPGLVQTPMLDEVPENIIRRRAARVPLGRAGTVADVSNLVLFLLSDEASYITGAEIVIDGGLGL